MYTNRMLGASTILVLSAMVALPALAQDSGNWKNTGGDVWKNASGQCWRAGYWTPAMANAACDPDLMPKPAPAPAKAPAPAPATTRVAPPPPAPPKPAPAPAAAKPAEPKRCDTAITLSADELFAFGKATLSKSALGKLKDAATKAKQCKTLEQVMVTGHSDRIGSQLGNLKLSEKRAEAVKAALVKQGLPKDKIESMGMGKTMPIQSCPDDKNRKALIKCLAPNRRAVIEIKGLAQ
jgi:OOP family OmpA-OmpF porin